MRLDYSKLCYYLPTMDENIGTMLAQVSRLLRRSFDARARGIGVTRPQWHPACASARSSSGLGLALWA